MIPAISIEELEHITHIHQAEEAGYEAVISLCGDLACSSQGAAELRQALADAVASSGHKIRIRRTGCMGPCAHGPLLRTEPHGSLYGHLKAADAPRIVDQITGHTPPIPELQCELNEHFGQQMRVVLENAGHIDPERIEDYIARGGYRALLTALTTMTPASVINLVTESELRGRGGGGYPTGLKWGTVAKAVGDLKYVICNGDEGDPGAFMDRSVMEGDPHRVLEGMMIAAYAVGASHGYVYVRAEYPLAVERLTLALRAARHLGLLGANIAGTSFSFEIEIRLGAGAFVCGEETALIASIEGRRGTPRPRPPYPAQCGLWGKPTLINNVETYANLPPILRHGAGWFASLGLGRSKGTKVFALTGRIKNTGLVEVPMGIPLRTLIEEIGGGVPAGHSFKAVQTGGPSGGCIPAELLHLQLTYESLIQAGSMMGSGGMIVMDDSSCMVAVARFFLDFCRSESCGKCTPCRAGTEQMYLLLTRISSGEATLRDLERLEQLALTVKECSLCGLGQSAPNPVLSTLRYFRAEYLEHIAHHRCPAGVCQMQPVEVAP